MIKQLKSGNILLSTKEVYKEMQLGDFLVKNGFHKFSVDSRTGILTMEYIDKRCYELEPSDMLDYQSGETLMLIQQKGE